MPARTKKAAAKPNVVEQGAKFGVVGISNTLIDYTLYIAITKILSVPLSQVYLVKYFSGTVAMVNSFYWNRRWVFKSRTQIGTSGIRFLAATVISVYLIQPSVVRLFSATTSGQNFGMFWFNLAHSLGIIGLAPHIFTQAFMIKTVAFGMGVLSAAVWDFCWYKFWAFRSN